ncbi:MAG: hypothetical protein GF346_10385 [Candidatus Eisenbacteria bacterium]|nr:hypothetical protein [Candidatus Latescibacterota bacterium]MBD3302843.1 hypothetical protein [Candidatus Eisenbacteria bacterium]
MKLLATVCFLVLAVSPGVAQDVTEGPAGEPIQLPDRQDVCQYGFQDDQIGSGYTLNNNQQLGIQCPAAGCISGVGFYCEFIVTQGDLDVVIYDDGTEVFRYTIPSGTLVEGVNDIMFGQDVAVGGDACIMLCPVDSFYAVTGEDFTNGPFGNTYFSNDCMCSNPFTSVNLTIWAHLCGAVPVSETSWGTVRMMYQ